MNTQQAYDRWAEQYDTNDNKTRDLEGRAMRAVLADVHFEDCLEIGCGTGKNTVWLAERARSVTAVDLSAEMLAKARAKVDAAHVQFRQADILQAWTFGQEAYDLVTFSLVLEHIEHLDSVFREASAALRPGGRVYLGELHPFKQYSGSKARFETGEGLQVVPCFDHHVSDFVQNAKAHRLRVVDLQEYFDEEDRRGVPRILTLLLAKPQ